MVANADPAYFGIAANEESYFFGARHLPNQASVVKAHDHSLEYVTDIDLPGVVGLHDMLWADGLLVCDTSRHSVLRVENGELRTVYRPDDLQGGQYHINSIWRDAEGRFYTSELSAKRLRRFDGAWNLEQEWNLDHPVHNVYAEGGAVWTCASAEGCLVRIDGDDRQYFPVGQGDFKYVRGLAKLGGYFYVGLSFTSERSGRDKGDSAVAVFDGERVVDTHVFSGTGQMNTIYPLES